ncbi:MAG: hypothetical protein K6G80_09670 [Treponema sp.]|nr:hypothetical protein [Treponema sp.]
MKNTHKIAGAVVLLAFLVSSCSDLSNLSVPKKVSVKATDQKYSFSAGEGTVSLSKHLNATTLLKNITENTGDSSGSGLAVYDYWPDASNGDDNTQQYLFNYSVATIPLDFGDYLNNMDLINELSKGVSQEIKADLPEEAGFTHTISLPDINAMIVDMFTASATLGGVETPAPISFNSTSLDEYGLAQQNKFATFTIRVPEFNNIEFATGTLNLALTRTDKNALADAYTYNVAVSLQDSNGNIISSSTAQELRAGGTVSLDLQGAKITPQMQLVLEGSFGGGSTLSVHTYSVAASLSADTKIAKITGLTITADQMGENQKLSLSQSLDISSIGNYLVESTVSEGLLTVSGTLPTGWSGFTCTPNFALTGGMEIAAKDFATVTATNGVNYLLNKQVNLSGKQITPQTPVTLAGELNFAINNATVVFNANDSSSYTPSIAIKGNVSIKKLGRTTIDIDTLMGNIAPISVSETFPDAVCEYVKEVEFEKLGVDISVTSTLPAEKLTFTPTISSGLLNLTNLSDTLEITANEEASLSLSTEEGWGCTVQPTTTTPLDFDATIELAGGDTAHPTYITLTEFEFGKAYTFEATVLLTYDWDHITLNTGDALSFSGSQKTGLDLQAMMDDYLKGEQRDMLEKVEIGQNMTAYLSISRPKYDGTDVDKLSSLSFSAKVGVKTFSKIDDAVVEDSDVHYFIGSEAAAKEIGFVEKTTDFASLADENGLIKKNVFADEDSYSAKISNLASVLNDHETNGVHTFPSDFEFIYEVGSGSTGEITLEKAELDALVSGGGKAEIGVDLSVVFPLEFKIKEGGIVISDVLDLAGKTFDSDEDVLGRSSPDEKIFERYQKYGELVKDITLSYKLTNNTNLSLASTITLIPEDTSLGIEPLVKTVTVDGNAHSLSLSKDEVTRILSAEAFPLQPKIGLTINEGTISIPRNGSFTAAASITLVLDGTVSVYDADED